MINSLILIKSEDEINKEGITYIGGKDGLPCISFSEETNSNYTLAHSGNDLFSDSGDILPISKVIEHIESQLPHYIGKDCKKWEQRAKREGIRILSQLYKYDGYLVTV